MTDPPGARKNVCLYSRGCSFTSVLDVYRISCWLSISRSCRVACANDSRILGSQAVQSVWLLRMSDDKVAIPVRFFPAYAGVLGAIAGWGQVAMCAEYLSSRIFSWQRGHWSTFISERMFLPFQFLPLSFYTPLSVSLAVYRNWSLPARGSCIQRERYVDNTI